MGDEGMNSNIPIITVPEDQNAPLAPTRSRARQSKKTHNIKWTPEEDQLLQELASQPNPKWSEIAKRFPTKTAHQVNDRWGKVLNPTLLKGSWTGEEDRVIVSWVKDHGARGWSELASKLPGRISKQCRERWHNHLCPDVLKAEWTPEEDEIIIEYQTKWGNKWSQIAALLPGRTDNSVKNRWNSSLKRRLDRIKTGQLPSFKRGRKPKSEIDVPVKSKEVPKPVFTNPAVADPTSAINLESPFPTPPVIAKSSWLSSPGQLLSPGISWSTNQSPSTQIALPSPFTISAIEMKNDLEGIPSIKLD